jgi:hypothetical protein
MQMNDVIKTDADIAHLQSLHIPETIPVQDIPLEGVTAEPEAPTIDDSIPEVQEPAPIQEAVKEVSKEVPDQKDTPRPQQNVTQEYDIRATNHLESGPEIVLPAHFDRETRRTLDRIPNVDMLDDPDTRRWASDVAEGLEYHTFNEAYVPTLEQEGADFRQAIDVRGTKLIAQAPKFKATEGQNLKGERAVVRLISHLGLGTLFQVPLWHTGIWLTFKPPTESEIIELNRIMLADKIKFGRYSYGLAFTNTTSYTTDRLVDFALSHVYDLTTTNEDINIQNLKDHISCQDVPTLLWGFICTMYPRGFRYRRACVADPEKCNYVLEETLNVMKLQWTDTSALSEWQKTHMSSRQARSKDGASIKRYKEELTRIQKRRICLKGKDEVYVTLRTPTVSQHVEAGHRWIGDIVGMVEKAIGTDADLTERNNLIIRHGQASAMRQYVHWVDSIEYGGNIIDDGETIEQTLSVLSGDDEIRLSFTKQVVEYIDQSTISVIGIPVFDCPSCGKTNESTLSLPQHKNIIPLDIMQLFFGLHTQRIERMTTR